VQVLDLLPDIAHHSTPIVPWSNQPVDQWLGVEGLDSRLAVQQTTLVQQGLDSRLAVQQTALVEQGLVVLVARMLAIPKAHNLVMALYPMLCSMESRPNLAVNGE
jgi:hypothetical protein